MTLQVLRDRLILLEANHLGAQLPILLMSSFYYENWRPSTSPSQERKKDEFFNSIRNRLQNVNANMDIEGMAGEIEVMTGILPSGLKKLCFESVRA
jgi:uncharacterized protein (DUF2267 family)